MLAASPSPLRVTNPATGAPLAELPSTTTAELDAAVARARRAQPRWAGLSTRARGRLLRAFAGRLLRDPELLPILIGESGKPLYEAEAIEVFYTCELTRFLTGRAGRRALADELRHPFIFANKRARIVQHPRGVVGVIGPWNWPLLNNFADCVAPLFAGNAVVLKPSPLTPLTSLHLAKLWRDMDLPEDVFQVVVGGADLGAALVDRADMIFFTGSQAAGRKVAQAAAARLIPCVLELGGKSAMIVLRDADLLRAARAAVWSSFANSGQVCVRTERVIVEEPVGDEFTRLCLAETARLRQGTDLANPEVTVDVGAITFPAQIERLERQLREATARGASIRAGGRVRPDLPGTFFEPTVVDGVTPEMELAREETFGPVLPILRARDAEHALALANDTPVGLSGSIWSRDAARAAELARRFETGSLCVNDVLVNYFCVEAPLGGIKQSGLGFRHGAEALRQFCRAETIIEDHPLLGFLSPFLGKHLIFPYNKPALRVLRWLMHRLY